MLERDPRRARTALEALKRMADRADTPTIPLRAQLERMWNNALATCKEVAEAATEEVP